MAKKKKHGGGMSQVRKWGKKILSGLHLGVGETPFVLVDPARGLEAGQLTTQTLGSNRRGDRLDVDGDVGPSGKRDQRLQPAG